MIRYGVVKGQNEAIFVRLEDCVGNDMRSGEAFEDILRDIELNINKR